MLAAAAFALPSGADEMDPVANPDACVVAGNARFTVLTDRLVRMEWSENGVFEDNATLAVINRNLPVPEFRVTRDGDAVRIRTSALTLDYSGEGRFDESNLSVSFRMNGRRVEWHPGMSSEGNLMGTARTLDGCMGPDKINNNDPMETGVLSRDGWAIVDESERHLFVEDGSDWGHWVASRPEGEVQDLYIFAYGHDYKAALADFTKIAGKIPLPPKFVFGYWWSRFKAYTADELVALGKEFRDRKIPMDVMIIDMDWHETWQRSARAGKDEFGQNVGWTGYSWNRDLIPDPEGLLGELHDMGFKTALNLHPASGIGVREDCYPEFVADYLSRTDDYDGPEGYVYKGGEQLANGKVGRNGYHAPVPFRIDQREWADAYFNSVLHPMEKQGVDFWWLDWQQWKTSKYTEGLSNTFWLNYTFFNDKLRDADLSDPENVQRPLIYHRWGGLGSHRYQLGFSGDTHILWSVLGYLPYFTATASNVGYGYWGHDLGGHMQRGNIPTDPELYTRWLQYGVFSPIFKTHCTSSEIIERRIWMFEDHYEYMKDAFELRYALTPYIYGAARQAYDTGVSLCRPMYYDYPEADAAYDYKEQYMFGDDILVATVCEPADSLSGLADREVWFPAGDDWYDMAHHEMIKGGRTEVLQYSIAENCWFVRAGAVIPMAREGIQSLQEKSNAFRVYVAPGRGRSSAVYYEDDGVSEAYKTEYASTLIEKNASASGCTLTLAAREGYYKDMPSDREVTVVFGGLSRKPASVTLDGEALECSYDAQTLEASVKLPLSSAAEETVIILKY